MRVDYRVFWVPKDGCSSEEYEDAFAPRQPVCFETSEFRCAVSDGATETSFSGAWADLLASGYVDEVDSLETMRAAWKALLTGKELPWYAEQKMEAGAFAAFVGLTVTDPGKHLEWAAQALGDSTVMHVRGDELLAAFPMDRWQEFDNSPILLSSIGGHDEGVLEELVNTAGRCNHGDRFYLLTDAISRWFLRVNAEGGGAVERLEHIRSQEEFEEFVAAERQKKDSGGVRLMPNDDVTYARVKLL